MILIGSAISFFRNEVRFPVNPAYDFDSLPEEVQQEMSQRIAEDHLENSNRFYPEAVIRDGFYNRFVKRALDLLISSLALILFFPINLLIGIITFFDVGSPIFFRQKRMGRNGRVFTMVKFRNMTNQVDENGVLLRADLRVTKWGKIVRATSLDELLNFINIFKGDMSIIGPRPLPLSYRGRFNKYHEIRHAVRPGLDCPLRDPSKLMTWENRLENDAWYARNVSFRTDMKLVFLLVRETLFGRDKENRSQGFSEGSFMGYYADGRVMDSNSIPPEFYEDLPWQGAPESGAKDTGGKAT